MSNRSLKGLGIFVAAAALVTGTTLAVAASASAAEDPNVTYAKAQVAKATPAIQAFRAPGPAVPNVASLAGKTVYYVPARGVVPIFGAIGEALKQSLGAASGETSRSAMRRPTRRQPRTASSRRSTPRPVPSSSARFLRSSLRRRSRPSRTQGFRSSTR